MLPDITVEIIIRYNLRGAFKYLLENVIFFVLVTKFVCNCYDVFFVFVTVYEKHRLTSKRCLKEVRDIFK